MCHLWTLALEGKLHADLHWLERGWLSYSSLAETFLAGGRIDFAARFFWLLDLLHPFTIAGAANNIVQNITRFLHSDQSWWDLVRKSSNVCALGAQFVNLKAILRLLLYFVDGKTENHFARAIEKLKLMVTNETAKLATLTESRR